MHDSMGREIRMGDWIKGKTYRGNGHLPVIAEVVALCPGSDTCNVMAAHAEVGKSQGGSWIGSWSTPSFNARETEIIMRADGSAPENEVLAKEAP